MLVPVAGEGVPALNCDPDTEMLFTVTVSLAVKLAFWFELWPTVVVGNVTAEPLNGATTGDPNPITCASRVPT
jgi:hypothetical protein